LKAYYDDHVSDYTNPEMRKIEALIFGTRPQADSAMERLQKGADFNWMKSNAEGQVDSNTPGLLAFTGRTIALTVLSEGVQKALKWAKPDEYRLYESPEGHFYVLYVIAVSPPSQEPYEKVREQITKRSLTRN
jgi:hypothetical protein